MTTLIQNAMENVENKILEVLENVGEKMAPVIKDFLLKSTNLVTYAARDKTAILNYLDENLVLLKQNLTEDNFERVLAVIWESSAQTLEETIYMCIEVKIKKIIRTKNHLHFFRIRNHQPISKPS